VRKKQKVVKYLFYDDGVPNSVVVEEYIGVSDLSADKNVS
jgi:hypothetical protein